MCETSFAAASAVRDLGDGTYAADIVPGWDIIGNAHGGYLLAIAARAAGDAAGRPDPVSVTAHYLSPGTAGAVSVGTRVLRSGRRFATVRADLSAGDTPILSLLGTFGDLADTGGFARVEGSPPELPDPGDCVRLPAEEPFSRPFNDRVELRLPPDDAAMTPQQGPLRVSGWIRFADGEPFDSIGLLLAIDALVPAAWRAGLPEGWTPTLELTVHVRARPAPGWLRGAFTTRFISGGLLEEDGELWDSAGRMVAQSRQLALVPRG